jgi:hypothetical protein
VIRLKIHPPTETAIQERLQITLQLLKDTHLAGCLAVSDGAHGVNDLWAHGVNDLWHFAPHVPAGA